VAGPGDRLVIPPDFGHVTVNIGTTPLVVADLVATASNNHYQGYAARQGGAVRIIAVPGEDDAFEAEWNPAYPEVDEGIEVVAAGDLAPFEADTPLYLLGTEQPERVAFLTDPSLGAFVI
jgi:glucose-6-phosphate isomerase